MLHGGLQQYENSGFRWTKTSGFGGYAPSNNLILLIPQVEAKANANPYGCWDFGGWGISDWENKYATNEGIQQKAIKAMVDKLTSPLQSDIQVQNIFDGYSDWTDTWDLFAREYLRDNGIGYGELGFVALTQIPWILLQYLWRISTASYLW